MKRLDAIDARIKPDLIKVTLAMVLSIWTLLSIVPWINLAYGDTAAWISVSFALTGAPSLAAIYAISLALATSTARADVQNGWRRLGIYVGAYAIAWVIAFAFLG